MRRWVFAISGASGAPFGLRVLEEMARSGVELHVVISRTAFEIVRGETGRDLSADSDEGVQANLRREFQTDHLYYHNSNNLGAPISSGSFITEGMLVVPCSMKTLASIANGYADNLTSRAADVTIKEGRKLILAPREMPFSAIHLENMLKLSRLGVTIAPPVPAFYQGARTLEDLVDFVAGKILDSAGIPNRLFHRWSGQGS